MSRFLAAIINSLNHDVSIERTLSPTEKLQTLIQRYRKCGNIMDMETSFGF